MDVEARARYSMFRASPLIVAAFTATAPLVADDGSVCVNCWDGPEMFEHRNASKLKIADVISVEDIGEFPDSCPSHSGTILKALGGVDWQVTECFGGHLRFAAAKDPSISSFTILREDGGDFSFDEDPPEEETARAAWLELQSLTKRQLDKLVREVRKHR